MILNKGQLAEDERKLEASENGVLGSEGDLSNTSILTFPNREKRKGTDWSQDQATKNQATKSAGWMPRHHTPMKDVVSCEKLRGTANKL